jgi:hypothetical protein
MRFATDLHRNEKFLFRRNAKCGRICRSAWMPILGAQNPPLFVRRMDCMDASLAGAYLWLSLCLTTATAETANFVVTAPTAEFAQQVADAAEIYRQELSVEWTGREMPRWSQRCPIHVKVGSYGAGGSTTFNFERGEVFGWNMQVQGTAERILDSVLPHEVNHTVFACYFRRPLPRWADEGAASLIEHSSERLRLRKIHEQAYHSRKLIPLQKLLSMKEYPTEHQAVLTLYAEGYSLADYLIQQSDKPTYLRFLEAAHQRGWEFAFREFYGYDSINTLESDVNRWLMAGSPDLNSSAGTQFALAKVPGKPGGDEPIVRAQSPDLKVELGPPMPWPASPLVARAPRRPDNDRSPLAFADAVAQTDPRDRSSIGTANGSGPRVSPEPRSQRPTAGATTRGNTSSATVGRLSRDGLVTPSLFRPASAAATSASAGSLDDLTVSRTSR